MKRKAPRDVCVRQMTKRDLTEAVRVFVRVYREPPYHEFWFFERARSYLAKILSLDPKCCFVARSRGALAGALLGYAYSFKGNRVVHVQELFVAKEHRRSGVARRLLGAAAGKTKERTVFTLFARIDAPAMKFYERLGFRQHRHYKFLFSRLNRTSLK